MNKRYLIALDLDRTLLKDDKTISPTTVSYLRHLDSLGHIITIASGRPERAILPYYRQLNLKAPFIAYNGALIRDPNDETFPTFELKEKPETLLRFIDAFGLSCFRNLFADNAERVYTLRRDEGFESMFHEENMEVIRDDFHVSLKEEVNAFCFDVYENEEVHKKMEQYYDSEARMRVRFWDMLPHIGELYYEDYNKKTGIEMVAKQYQIPFTDTIAFGDSENDLQMLSGVAHGFVMKNGSDRMKKTIGSVALDDNEHDGIVKTLQQFFQIGS